LSREEVPRPKFSAGFDIPGSEGILISQVEGKVATLDNPKNCIAQPLLLLCDVSPSYTFKVFKCNFNLSVMPDDETGSLTIVRDSLSFSNSLKSELASRRILRTATFACSASSLTIRTNSRLRSHKAEENIQKLTDEFIKSIDEKLDEKENSLLEI
jgi:hypothetical protein